MTDAFDTVIIGGGFYGLRIALYLREHLNVRSVLVLEREPTVMERASYVNQARAHNGYHYPRSMLTAYRSRVNLPDFQREYGDAIVDDFVHYYAIAARQSKTNAKQFELFCARVGIVCEPAEPDVTHWFSPALLDAAYRVEEPAFDTRIVRDIALHRIRSAGGIVVATSDEAERVEQSGDDLVVWSSSGQHRAEHVISSTYSGLNELHRRSGLPTVPVQHEITEMALVELDPPFRDAALTVMDGPFFSVMPFPSRGLHSLSHVRFTPHHRWRDTAETAITVNPYEALSQLARSTNYPVMFADVVRYVPALTAMRHVDSLWEVKTVLTRSEMDDSRPILFKPHHGLRNFTAIMGGKFDNVYDVLEELSVLYG